MALQPCPNVHTRWEYRPAPPGTCGPSIIEYQVTVPCSQCGGSGWIYVSDPLPNLESNFSPSSKQVSPSSESNSCLSGLVFVVVIVLCAWFYAWFEDYAAHSPLFQFIGAFYHYVTAVPWRAYWSLAPTSSAGINGLMGILGLVSVPATLIWLRRKQEFLPPRTQRRLSRLWIVLCIAALIFVAPVLTGIFWLISLGIWNLVLLLIHSFFKKT
jgi:hypothetical protein